MKCAIILGSRKRALNLLARMSEKAGDVPEAKALAKRAVDTVRAKPPATFQWGEVSQVHAYGRDTFIDFEREFDAGMTQWFREEQTVIKLAATHGDLDEAVRAAKSLPDGSGEFALMQITGQIAHGGDIAGAMKLASTIKDPAQRVSAIQMAAGVVRDGAKHGGRRGHE